MATKKHKTSKAVKEEIPVGVKDKIKDVYLDEQSDKDYYIYGTSTIEDRAIVGTYDGVKPVTRRTLWAMFKLNLHHKANTVKAAKIVGDTMGDWHPHGDSSIFQAAVTASQLPQPLVDGSDSNWGTMLSGSGAMRYINGRLTKYSDKVFFDPFYMPTMAFAANYDGSKREPVNLVTLLPNGLLNGNFGICPGVNTRTPAYTLPSVVSVLKNMIKAKGKCDAKMCEELEWISDYGGHVKKTKANKVAIKQFYKTGTAQVTWSSTYTLNEAQNSIRYTRFAPISTNDKSTKDKASPLERLLTNIENIPGVSSIDSDGEGADPFRVAYLIRFNKTCKGEQREKVIKAIDVLFSETQRYDVKVTDRVFNSEEDMVDVKLRPITVPQLLEEWLLYRIHLEKTACAYWIEKRKKEIAYLELMRLAISQLDFIFKCIKDRKLDDAALVKKIGKQLKITDEQTNQILGRNLRQLRHLEDQKLSDEIKAILVECKGYQARMDKPSKYIMQHLDTLAEELVKKPRKK
jgi:DNA gyrase/topoisomerase IV subunit A